MIYCTNIMVHEQLSNKVCDCAMEEISQLWYIAAVKYLVQQKSQMM
jgi:hypothetical protein